MARSDIRDTLQNGEFVSVMNILMQLRNVCNHPDLFEERQIWFPLSMRANFYQVPTVVAGVFSKPSQEGINLDLLSLYLCSVEENWPGEWHTPEALRISAERQYEMCFSQKNHQRTSQMIGKIQDTTLWEPREPHTTGLYFFDVLNFGTKHNYVRYISVNAPCLDKICVMCAPLPPRLSSIVCG